MRKLVLLLAAALALTACTAAPEVSSPAEAAPPAETAAIGEAATAFPVGTLQMAIPEVMDTGAASVEIPFSGLETEPILKLDYAAGVQTKLCDIDLSRQIPVAIMQHGDTVEYFWDSEGSTVFAHTAIRPDGSVEEQTIPEKFYPNFYDEYAAYDIWGTACKRLDWQTGELTPVAAVCAVGWRSGCSRQPGAADPHCVRHAAAGGRGQRGNAGCRAAKLAAGVRPLRSGDEHD